MNFYEVVDQVVQLLQQRGRLTYRSLKRQFALDDEVLEDLKDELQFSHPVVDEAGRGLVWRGETVTKPASPSILPVPQEIPPQAHPTQAAEAPPSEPAAPAAERRQLTVMFCDLVDSTKLSGQLDPEDYREVLRAYHSAGAEVIHRFDGHIAQHLGDALLVYFGYPTAHEDDARRAIHTGLGMLGAMRTLHERLAQAKAIRLRLRVGMHTGLAVISAVGSEQKHEMLALGEAPNVASRIQGLAEPDTIAISADTYRLVEGYFDYNDLGLHSLKGVAELHRLKGKWLLNAKCSAHNVECTAESCFHQALDVSRQQQAKSWELRAATGLARLWQAQGKRQDAYDLLAPVYGWCTEGVDTADLQDAKALLDDLESGGR